jgi:diguanylate cyclase (GGDEF)-like protein
MAVLKAQWGTDRYLVKSARTSPHVAWAVGSAGLLSAGLFLLVKRAKLFRWAKYQPSRPTPPTMSTYDSVTGLPTRRLFMTLANQAVSRARKAGRRVAILMVELDHFALAEDLHEAVHNNLLYRVQAARLKSALRTTDTIARLGERSFAALLENIVDGAAIAAVAAKMQATVSLPFVLEGREVFLTSRIGIGVSSPDAKDATSLVDLAAQAVAQAGTESYIVYGLPGTLMPAPDPMPGVRLK